MVSFENKISYIISLLALIFQFNIILALSNSGHHYNESVFYQLNHSDDNQPGIIPSLTRLHSQHKIWHKSWAGYYPCASVAGTLCRYINVISTLARYINDTVRVPAWTLFSLLGIRLVSNARICVSKMFNISGVIHYYKKYVCVMLILSLNNVVFAIKSNFSVPFCPWGAKHFCY